MILEKSPEAGDINYVRYLSMKKVKGSSDPSYFFLSTSIFYDIVYTRPAST